MSDRERVNAEIRQVLADHARLPVDVDTLADDADLSGRDDVARERQRDARARGRVRHRVPGPDAHSAACSRASPRSPRRSSELEAGVAA